MTIQIAASILAADFGFLSDRIRSAEEGGADLIHFDVMDGHFVPNISMGPPVLASIRKLTKLPLDVHLMIEDPDRYISMFAEAGANWISVHYEACRHLHRTLDLMRSLDLHVGVVLNPATPITVLEEVLKIVDYVLIMSVNPGFGGQRFISNSLEKIQRLRKILQHKGLSARIEVDGGVGFDNIPSLVRSGAQILVAGSQIFGVCDPAAAVRQMKQIADRCALDPHTIA
jgi:ribulose-phosphate 3-epimerase